MADWAERDACGGEPIETFADGDTRCRTWEGCADGSSVELCSIDGGGHTWPAAPWSATDWILAFFEAHARR
jgi:polyhydroxybutyrate depolymerase